MAMPLPLLSQFLLGFNASELQTCTEPFFFAASVD
jgi:hypothetical protein